MDLYLGLSKYVDNSAGSLVHQLPSIDRASRLSRGCKEQGQRDPRRLRVRMLCLDKLKRASFVIEIFLIQFSELPLASEDIAGCQNNDQN